MVFKIFRVRSSINKRDNAIETDKIRNGNVRPLKANASTKNPFRYLERERERVS